MNCFRKFKASIADVLSKFKMEYAHLRPKRLLYKGLSIEQQNLSFVKDDKEQLIKRLKIYQCLLKFVLLQTAIFKVSKIYYS